jgi:hypothetical protein
MHGFRALPFPVRSIRGKPMDNARLYDPTIDVEPVFGQAAFQAFIQAYSAISARNETLEEILWNVVIF